MWTLKIKNLQDTRIKINKVPILLRFINWVHFPLSSKIILINYFDLPISSLSFLSHLPPYIGKTKVWKRRKEAEVKKRERWWQMDVTSSQWSSRREGKVSNVWQEYYPLFMWRRWWLDFGFFCTIASPENYRILLVLIDLWQQVEMPTNTLIVILVGVILWLTQS